MEVIDSIAREEEVSLIAMSSAGKGDRQMGQDWVQDLRCGEHRRRACPGGEGEVRILSLGLKGPDFFSFCSQQC